MKMKKVNILFFVLNLLSEAILVNELDVILSFMMNSLRCKSQANISETSKGKSS